MLFYQSRIRFSISTRTDLVSHEMCFRSVFPIIYFTSGTFWSWAQLRLCKTLCERAPALCQTASTNIFVFWLEGDFSEPGWCSSCLSFGVQVEKPVHCSSESYLEMSSSFHCKHSESPTQGKRCTVSLEGFIHAQGSLQAFLVWVTCCLWMDTVKGASGCGLHPCVALTMVFSHFSLCVFLSPTSLDFWPNPKNNKHGSPD